MSINEPNAWMDAQSRVKFFKKIIKNNPSNKKKKYLIYHKFFEDLVT